MQKANLSWLFMLNIALLAVLFISLSKPSSVKSAIAEHLVISEIQLSGSGGTTQDFVELYNPTASDLSLQGMRLVKRSSTATEDASLVAFNSGDTIPAHGYFLWCNSSLSNILNCDKTTSGTVSDNNSIALRNGALDIGAIVDAVTFGSPVDPLGEGTSLTAPDAGQSVERKAHPGSTAESMTSGVDANEGNGEDTDNNSADFILRTLSDPQYSTSSAEISTPPASPSATTSVSPSSSPTATPFATASASSSASPSATPSASAPASPSMSPSANPNTSPSPTPNPSRPKLVCRFEPIKITFGKFEFSLFHFSCKWNNT